MPSGRYMYSMRKFNGWPRSRPMSPSRPLHLCAAAFCWPFLTALQQFMLSDDDLGHENVGSHLAVCCHVPKPVLPPHHVGPTSLLPFTATRLARLTARHIDSTAPRHLTTWPIYRAQGTESTRVDESVIVETVMCDGNFHSNLVLSTTLSVGLLDTPMPIHVRRLAAVLKPSPADLHHFTSTQLRSLRFCPQSTATSSSLRALPNSIVLSRVSPVGVSLFLPNLGPALAALPLPSFFCFSKESSRAASACSAAIWASLDPLSPTRCCRVSARSPMAVPVPPTGHGSVVMWLVLKAQPGPHQVGKFCWRC